MRHNRASRDVVSASRGSDGTENAIAPVGRDPTTLPATEDLDRLDHDLLRRRWRSVIGRPAPAALSRQLMIRILQWREQIARVEDIDARTRAVLAVALNDDKPPEGAAASTQAAAVPRPGSVLVREHAGVLHRVMALEQGYAWNGQTFASLSAVALAITGTRWNGRRFFGLNRPQAAARDRRETEVKVARWKGRSP